MALPKIDVPIYSIKLLSSGKAVRYRPFTVKEEKLFLMANESEDLDSVVDTIKQVINNCILDKIDVDSLPMFDIEYLFLNIRAKSIGEVVNLKYKCNNEVDGKVCGNIMEAKIDLTDIKPEWEEKIDPEIQLTDKIVVKLRYPKFSIIKDSVNMDNITDVTFNMIASSIEHIYDGEQFYYAKETPKEELLEFIEQLNQTQFEKIEKFFANLPKMKKKIGITCSKCGFIHNMEVEGLENFFAF